MVVESGDNGPGIPLEVMPHLFELFFTAKGVGQATGLGLDTVQRIMKKHRGKESSQPAACLLAGGAYAASKGLGCVIC